MSYKPKDMVLRPRSQPLDAQLSKLDRSVQQRQNAGAKVHKLTPPPRPKIGK